MREIHRFRVPADHPSLAGHFPGRPIVPGVLLLDAALTALDAATGLRAPLQLVRVKFLAPVLPEEPVSVLVGEPERGTVAFACEALGQRVLSAVVRPSSAQPWPA